MKTLRQILKQYITIYRIWKAFKTIKGIRPKRLRVFFVIRVFQILDNNASRFVNNLVNYIIILFSCVCESWKNTRTRLLQDSKTL